MSSPAETGMVTVDDVRAHPEVRVFIERADRNLEALGYTEHGFRHADLCAKRAYGLMMELGYDEHTAQLSAIGGYLHDAGNAVNRKLHASSSAFIAYNVLKELGMPPEDVATVMSAVGNHDEPEGDPVDTVSAAVILADKSDVHKGRVRNLKHINFDIHDRVNYAAQKSVLVVQKEPRVITLEIEIDDKISKVLEYFEIFLDRMLRCQRACKFLDAEFSLVINGSKVL